MSRAARVRRGCSWESSPARGGVLVVGGVGVPLSHITIAEPSKGKPLIVGIPAGPRLPKRRLCAKLAQIPLALSCPECHTVGWPWHS
jgi:hypothetical protein